ncbi:uncharacterized protein DNG_07630 [Cephalotrichum gorgonifer]|uniref:Uncharacterized protein n=1 Tax=Cephalotrichum gorgonifer TaxID=2041049 RepID=A0AAE8N514_9PEZI|nr:uncharacterized protein DNG_07630 [Cephalotrichum gorgonifer]
MVKQNDVIAIIVIILFILLAGISFGIYRLVHTARHHASVTSTAESSSSSSGSGSGDVNNVPNMRSSAPCAAEVGYEPEGVVSQAGFGGGWAATEEGLGQ